MNRVFLLSPARVGGKRAAMLMRPAATFELARQVQIEAAELGAIFAFCSGLYFRGKLAYARRFARPPAGIAGVQVITPSRGLVDADTLLGLRALTEFIEVPIDSTEPRFVEPLRQSAAALAGQASLEVVLLGSIATGKYSDTLLPVFGERLLCPSEFSGRGDMSRGALLLRSVAAGQELAYAPVAPVVPASRRKSPKTGPDAPSRGG